MSRRQIRAAVMNARVVPALIPLVVIAASASGSTRISLLALLAPLLTLASVAVWRSLNS